MANLQYFGMVLRGFSGTHQVHPGRPMYAWRVALPALDGALLAAVFLPAPLGRRVYDWTPGGKGHQPVFGCILTTAAAHVMPAPKETRSRLSVGRMQPLLSFSASASGIEAAEVLA
jgi:hypothetical protein